MEKEFQSRLALVLTLLPQGEGILRACLKTTGGSVFCEKGVWQGATKENTPGGSSTEEQRRQTAFAQKTLREAGLLPVAGVGSVVTARCGDAPTSQSAQYESCPLCGLPWPQPKSSASEPLVVFKQALRPPPFQNLLIYAPGLRGFPLAVDDSPAPLTISPQFQMKALWPN
jgi:hypothetical protein